MTVLSYRKLNAQVDEDRNEWRQIFRATPSFTFATEGRVPQDADADAMLDTIPEGGTKDDVFAWAIYADGTLCGGIFVARDFPAAGQANLVLLVITEAYQGANLGVRCLMWIESQARSWNCTRLTGVADFPNKRAVKFWGKLGFIEERRLPMPGRVGEVVVGYFPLDAVPTNNSATRRLRQVSRA